MAKVRVEFTPHEDHPEVAVFRLQGDLDSATIPILRQRFEEMMGGKFTFVVAEMSRASSLSSATLGELMGCRTRLVERGGDLVLAGLSIGVREKLTAMDANKIFKFYNDVRSSLNAYRWEFHGRSESIDVRIPSRLGFVPPVRQLVSRISKQKGYNNRDSFRIETIVDEVCNNAVEHGIDSDDSAIDLQVSINRKKIEIKVTNASDPKKINALKEISRSLFVPKMTDEMKRGRGLSLVKMLSNEFNIEYSGVGTCVHVTKLREE